VAVFIAKWHESQKLTANCELFSDSVFFAIMYFSNSRVSKNHFASISMKLRGYLFTHPQAIMDGECINGHCQMFRVDLGKLLSACEIKFCYKWETGRT
jgi:hypothetical protein